MEKFISLFVENDVDDTAFGLLDEEALKELKLPIGGRIKLLSRLKQETLALNSANLDPEESSMDDSVTTADGDDQAENAKSNGSSQSDLLIYESSTVPPVRPSSKSPQSPEIPPQVRNKSPKAIPEASPDDVSASQAPSAAPTLSPSKPSCCSRFGRSMLSGLYYVFIFPFIMLWRLAVLFATAVVLPAIPTLVLLPAATPTWLFYYSEIVSDISRGIFHPVFAAASISFLIAAPSAIIGLQVLWCVWLYDPAWFGSESKPSAPGTPNVPSASGATQKSKVE